MAGAFDGPLLASLLEVRSAESPAHLRTQVFTLGAGLKVSAASLGSAAFALVVALPATVIVGLIAAVHAIAALLGFLLLGGERGRRFRQRPPAQFRFCSETDHKSGVKAEVADGRYPGSVRRGLGLTTVVLALAACGPFDGSPGGGANADADADCAAKAKASAAAVHTDHRFTDQQVPGIGTYLDIHWQVRALGNPCSRLPGPTDWQYQALVQLAAPDATSLVKSHGWTPSAAPAAWPALAALIPAGAAWTAPAAPAAATDQTMATPTMAAQTMAAQTTVYFEPNRGLVFFTLTDS